MRSLAFLLLCLPLPSQSDAGTPDARAIHERVLTLDTHKDIQPQFAPAGLPEDPEEAAEMRRLFDPAVDGAQQVDFPKMRRGGLDGAFFIVYVGQGRNDGAGFVRAKRRAMTKFRAIHRMQRLYPDRIGLALRAADVPRLHEEGKLIVCIGIENGYPMGDDPANVETFHMMGARYMSICHNRHNQLGDSHTPDEPLHGGLSDLGRRAIEEMNRVGIMVDVSHSARTTMMQTVEHSRAPVIASHSACHALRAHGRNLDDEQLRALAANGGVIQIVALGNYLRDTGDRRRAIGELREELGLPRPGRRSDEPIPDLEAKLAEFERRMAAIDERFPPASVTDLVDHIDHAVEVAGIDHVGISSDFDGGGGIEGWDDAGETFNVTRELVARGYSEAEIARIWSGNLLRVWREVEEHAAAPGRR